MIDMSREAAIAITGFLGFNVSLLLIFVGAIQLLHITLQGGPGVIPIVSQETAWGAIGLGTAMIYLSFRLTKLADDQHTSQSAE